MYSAARKSRLGGLFPWLKEMNLHDVQLNGTPIECVGKEDEEEVGEEEDHRQSIVNGSSEEVGGMEEVLPLMSPRRVKLRRRRRAIMGLVEDETVRRINMGKEKLTDQMDQHVQDGFELDLQEEEELNAPVSTKCNAPLRRRLKRRGRRGRISLR